MDRISGPPGSGKPFNPDGTTSLPEGAWNISGAYFFETLDEVKEGDAVIFNADFIDDLKLVFDRLNGGEADVTTVSPEHKSLIITALFNLIAIGIKYNLETNYENNDLFKLAIDKIVGALKTADKFNPDPESKDDLDKAVNALSDFAGNKDAHTNAAGLVKSAKNASLGAGKALTMLKATTLSPANISNTKTLIRSFIHDIDSSNGTLETLDTNHPFAKIRQYIRQVLAYKAKAESYLTELERIETGKAINNASAAKTARQVRVSAIVGRPLNASVTKAVPNTSQLVGGGAGTGNASATTVTASPPNTSPNASPIARVNKSKIIAEIKAEVENAEAVIVKITPSVERLEAYTHDLTNSNTSNSTNLQMKQSKIGGIFNIAYGDIIAGLAKINRNKIFLNQGIINLDEEGNEEGNKFQARFDTVMADIESLRDRVVAVHNKYPVLLAYYNNMMVKFKKPINEIFKAINSKGETLPRGGSASSASSASSELLGGGSVAPLRSVSVGSSGRSSIPISTFSADSLTHLPGSVRKQRGGRRVTKKAKKATKATKAKKDTRRKTRR